MKHLFALIFSLSAFYVQGQSVVYVTPLGAGNQSGSSWSDALPGNQLQSRLASASSGTQFWVTGGTYKPTTGTDRAISFRIPSGVQVYGGFSGSESTLNGRPSSTSEPSSTTFSGDIGLIRDYLDNSYHVVRFDNVNDQTLLNRVTITAGYASGPILNGSIPHSYGAGIFNNAQYSGNRSLPTISDCDFIGNTAVSYGGAICNSVTLQARAVLTLLNCRFINNSGYGGGAIYNEAGSTGQFQLFATNCVFTDNRASYFGGGVSSSIRDASTNNVTFTNCIFTGNHAGWNGGAIHNQNDSGSSLQIKVLNSLLFNNSCRYGGAGINNNSTGASISIQVTNSTLVKNNNIEGLGGAIRSSSFEARLPVRSTIQNCIVW